MDELEPHERAAWEVDELSPDFEERLMDRLEHEGLAKVANAAVEPATSVASTGSPIEPRRRRWRGLAAATVAMAAAAVLTWTLVVRPSFDVRRGAVAVSDSTLRVELRPGVDARVSPGGALTWEADVGVRVQQTQGLVRYDVTPGTAVAVRTPAGTVDVTGTVFSVEVLTMSDVSKLKSRSFLAAGVVAATVIAVVVVHEGRVGANNERGAVEVEAGHRAVMTDASPPRSLSQDEETSSVAAAREPEPSSRRHVSPEQRRRHALTRQKIERALARRGQEPQREREPDPPEGSDPPPATAGATLDKEYVREAIQQDLLPLAKECYRSVLEDDPDLSGTLVVEFDIMGDKDVGGIVDDVQLGEGTDVAHPDFVECISESMMTVVFPPPESGGVVHVSYPLLFSSE